MYSFIFALSTPSSMLILGSGVFRIFGIALPFSIDVFLYHYYFFHLFSLLVVHYCLKLGSVGDGTIGFLLSRPQTTKFAAT